MTHDGKRDAMSPLHEAAPAKPASKSPREVVIGKHIDGTYCYHVDICPLAAAKHYNNPKPGNIFLPERCPTCNEDLTGMCAERVMSEQVDKLNLDLIGARLERGEMRAERDRLREEVRHYRVALFNDRESTSKALRKQGEQVKELLAALTLYHRASIAPGGTKQQADLGREAYLARRAAIASAEGRSS